MSLFDGKPDAGKMLCAPSIRSLLGEWVGSMRNNAAVFTKGLQ
jgi:hypothetical protein